MRTILMWFLVGCLTADAVALTYAFYYGVSAVHTLCEIVK